MFLHEMNPLREDVNRSDLLRFFSYIFLLSENVPFLLLRTNRSVAWDNGCVIGLCWREGVDGYRAGRRLGIFRFSVLPQRKQQLLHHRTGWWESWGANLLCVVPQPSLPAVE